MPLRWDSAGAGRGGGPWAVLLVLLLAVLVPTACVLWFMTAAMRNVRLATRQRLTEVYRERLSAARAGLEKFWSQKAVALDNVPKAAPARVFAALVRAGVADSVIVYDEAGRAAYPSAAAAGPAEPPERGPGWQEAEELEYELSQADEAADAYARIAEWASEANLKARALQAQARCLLGSGRRQEAVRILTGPLAGDSLRGVGDAGGRLIGPNALLLALGLMKETDGPEFRGVARELANRLNDYGGPGMPSSQRRFLMERLREIAASAAAFRTLAAENLAADYLAARQGLAEAWRLSKARPGSLWHAASKDKRVVLIFRRERLLADMKSAAGLADRFAGAALSLVPPRPAAPKGEVFLTVPAATSLPGWELQVHLEGQDPFAAAAGRENAAYLWTGIVAIGIIAMLALIVARTVSRQMRLARLKNDLIATVSHELKTPLAAVRMLVETLLEGRVRNPQQAREYLQLMARENERLTRMIDNFLTFSRMERNKVAFDFTRLRPEEFISAAVACVQEKFNKPGCRLEVDVAPDLPPITGDRDALVTVLLNLLDNAYKYSRDDKRVALRAYAADGNVCVEVTDEGIGLSRWAAKKIFGRFYQVDRTLSRGAGGCGLGLSIVKFIVDAHGGTIDLTSQLGKGSTFTVRLPIAGAASANESGRNGRQDVR